MPVSFNSIPANWKMPLYWVEVDPSMAGYPRSRLTSLLFGLMSADGTALPNVPIPVPSQADARQLFGYGSMLDGMVETFTKNNFAQELWVVPIEEATAGVPATGAIDRDDASDFRRHAAGLYRGPQGAGGASRLARTWPTPRRRSRTAINADPSMPVTALVGTLGALDLTCEVQGRRGQRDRRALRLWRRAGGGAGAGRAGHHRAAQQQAGGRRRARLI